MAAAPFGQQAKDALSAKGGRESPVIEGGHSEFLRLDILCRVDVQLLPRLAFSIAESADGLGRKAIMSQVSKQRQVSLETIDHECLGFCQGIEMLPAEI